MWPMGLLLLYSQSEVSYAVISELHKQIISYQITVSDVIDQLPAFCNLNLCHTRMIILYRYKKYEYFIVFNSNIYKNDTYTCINNWKLGATGRVNGYSSGETSWPSPSDDDLPTPP